MVEHGQVVLQLLQTTQAVADGAQLLHQQPDGVGQADQLAGVAVDDLGVDAVAGGPPLVLPDDPSLGRGSV